MSIFKDQIDEVLFNIQCENAVPHMKSACRECTVYHKVKDLVTVLDEAQEANLMASVLRGSALQLLQTWMAHAKDCKEPPEVDCKFCVAFAKAAQSAMKKIETLDQEKVYLDRIKAVEEAAAKLDKLGPDLIKEMNEKDKRIADLTLFAQRYYMMHSVEKGSSSCGCDICKEVRMAGLLVSEA